MGSSSSPLDHANKYVTTTFNGHALWVPKGAHSMKMKLHAEKTMLWHQGLGYIGEKGLRTIKNKSLVEGLNDCNLCKES